MGRAGKKKASQSINSMKFAKGKSVRAISQANKMATTIEIVVYVTARRIVFPMELKVLTLEKAVFQASKL